MTKQKKETGKVTAIKAARKQSPSHSVVPVDGTAALATEPADMSSRSAGASGTVIEIDVASKVSTTTKTGPKSKGAQTSKSRSKSATESRIRLVTTTDASVAPAPGNGPDDDPDGPDDPGAAGVLSRPQMPDDPFTPQLALLADLEGLNPMLRQNLEIAQQILQGHLAANTRTGYKSSWKQWNAYAVAAGECPLPAKPEVVAAFLAELAITSDENGAVLENGKFVRNLVPGTVAQRLQAINKAHEVAGHPKPGADPLVKGVVMGIRREFGVRPEHQRRPIDMAMLISILAAMDNQSRERLNANLIAILVGIHGWTAGQLVRLRWADIELDPTDVVIVVPSIVPGQPGKTLTVRRHRDPRVCLVRALTEMSPYRMHQQEVLTKKDGAAYSRFGMHKKVVALRDLAGDAAADDGTLAAAFIRRRFEVVGDRTPKEVRDRAMLLLGFSCALRRANIVDLNWGDLEHIGEDWGVTIRRSKTDPYGADQHTLWLPIAAEGYPCPTAAMIAWHKVVTRILGSDPRKTHPDLPLFFPIDRHGATKPGAHGARFARMSGTAVNRMVQERVYAVLPQDRPARGAWKTGKRNHHQWGAHSLRAGFVTEATRGNKLNYGQIQRVTRHQSISMVMRYDRNENARENNPSLRLFQPPTS